MSYECSDEGNVHILRTFIAHLLVRMHRGRRVAAGIAGVNRALHYIAIFMHCYALTDIPTLPILQGVSQTSTKHQHLTFTFSKRARRSGMSRPRRHLM
jgi:hypothetical protein